MKDYYKILGVSKDAPDEEIKKAYRKLAHEYHPDRPGGNEARFKEINEAYQVLSNKEKKAQYDRFGEVPEGAAAGYGGAWNPFGEGGFSAGFGGFGAQNGFGVDFEDIFEGIFGGSGGQRRRTYTQGSDVELEIQITLEEAFRGVARDIKFKTNVLCDVCGGVGYDRSKGTKKCATCVGKGEVKVERKTFFGNFSQVKLCPDCGGRGEIPNVVCKNCKGEGKVFSSKSVAVDIAPGIEDGQIVKVSGGGEAGSKGGASGDLYIVIRITPHPVFTRKKSDLYVTKDIDLAEALLGKEIGMHDVGGEKFGVVIPTGFSLNEKMKIAKRGMPKFGMGSRGDLYVTFNLKLPKHLSPRAKKMIEELDDELKNQ